MLPPDDTESEPARPATRTSDSTQPSMARETTQKLRQVLARARSYFKPSLSQRPRHRIELDGLRFDIFKTHASLTGATGQAASEITVPAQVDGRPVTTITQGAFHNSPWLQSISIPDTVTTIGAGAFSGCAALTSAQLPPDMEVIDARTFEDCTSLSVVQLPHGLRRIGSRAFAGCRSLERTPHRVWTGPRQSGRLSKKMQEDNLPVTLEYIGDEAFRGCRSLTRVVVPYRVTTVRTSTFEECLALQDVWLHSRVRSVKTRAFAGCESLARLSVPAATDDIRDDAFAASTTIVAAEGSAGQTYAQRNGNPTVDGSLPPEPVISAFASTSSSLRVEEVLEDPHLLQGILDRYQVRPPALEIEPSLADSASDSITPSRFRFEDGVYRCQEDRTGTPYVTLAMVGDLMCGFRQQRSAFDGNEFDFSATFVHIEPVLARTDLALGNLESMVAKSYPSMKDRLYVDDRPHLNAPFAYVAAIRNAGFDGVLNAQNHMYDTGPKGVLETLAAVNRAELAHGGMYVDQREPRYLLFEIKGMTIGVVAYLDPARQRMKQVTFTDEGLAAMASPYDARRMAEDITAVRAAGAEFVLAYCHWGREFTAELSTSQKRYAQMVADAGADYIFGSHSHCPQPYAVLTSRNGRTVPVVYSGGNFVSDITRSQPITRDTFVSTLVLERDDSGQVRMKEDGYIPCRIIADRNTRGHVQVVPTESLKEGTLGYGPETARADIARLQSIMGERYRRISLASLIE